MIRMSSRTIVSMGVLLGCWLIGFGSESRSDWPQFRGPFGDGRVDGTKPPVRWGGFFDKPTWQTPIPGKGWSSPVVVGNRVWLTTGIETALNDRDANSKLTNRPFGVEDFQTHQSVELYAIEVDADTGRLLRSIPLLLRVDPNPIHSWNSYATPTPATDGKHLYCHFGSLGTVCIDLTTGAKLWEKRFELEEITGPGGSPVVWKDRLLIACDTMEEQFVIALDTMTGETVWKTIRPPISVTQESERRSFSTPLVIEWQGRTQLISVGAQWLVSYDPENGAEWWRAQIGTGHACVPRPVHAQGIVFACTGYWTHELVAVNTTGRGDVTDTHTIWRYSKQVPEVSSPVLWDEELYMVSSMGIATCLDAKTGKEHWVHRLGGNYVASPTVADGRVFFTSKEGVTTVIEAGKEYKEIARNELFGETFASMANYRDYWIIRTHPDLFCIGRSEVE